MLICVTRHGFVCANAGRRRLQRRRAGRVVLLPADPDASARALRARLRELTGVAPGVLVTDSFGRAWRHGQSDVAIGCAGLAPLEDWRGRAGRARAASCARHGSRSPTRRRRAADLARAKDSREPAVLLRGLERHVTGEDGPGAQAILRARRGTCSAEREQPRRQASRAMPARSSVKRSPERAPVIRRHPAHPGMAHRLALRR